MNYKKRAGIFAGIFLLTWLAGCTKPENNTPPASAPTVQEMSAEDMFTDRDFETEYDEKTVTEIVLEDGASRCNSSSVSVQGNVITIAGEGVYRLHGTLSNGCIAVDADKSDKIRLILDGVSVRADTTAALYIKQADKVFVTLADETENTLSTEKEYVATDDNKVDGAVFSKEDLTFNGNGMLTVASFAGHGIVCKDSLVITGGRYAVTAALHAMQAKDDVRIAQGTFELSAAKDGIHAENTEDTDSGFVYIKDGSFTLNTEGDGFSSSGRMQIDGGVGTVITGGGAQTASADERKGFSNAISTNNSAKGMKACGSLLLAAGTWEMDCADDALHTNADAQIRGGTWTLATGDDGVHADETLTVSGGTVTVTTGYEGLEGNAIDLVGGTVQVTVTDDGINAAGGADQSGFGGRMPHPDRFSADDGNCYVRISGGCLRVNASGDGIDSNGSVTVTGGETYISGPTDNQNTALDYESTAEISGGIFVAAGSSGMAENFTTATGQGALMVNTGTSSDGGITLKNGNEELLSWSPDKPYSCVIVSAPGVQKGNTYTLLTGDQTHTVKMTDWLYTVGGMGNGMGGTPPDRGERGGFAAPPEPR